MVIVRAPIHAAIVPQPVKIVAGAEDVHPAVEDMGLTVSDVQLPGQRKDGVLGFPAHGDPATVLGAGTRVAHENPSLAIRQGMDLPLAVHLHDGCIGGSPDQTARLLATHIQKETVPRLHHRGGTVERPGAFRDLLAGDNSQQDGSDA